MKKQYIWILILVLLIGVYVIWNYYQKKLAEKTLHGSGTIETTEIEVGSRVGGRVIQVMFKEGNYVKPEDILVQLDRYQIDEQKKELEAQIAQANARLKELETGPRPQEIAAAEARYKQARARANLVEAGARREEVAQAEANRRQAEADMENAQRNLYRLKTLFERKVISAQEFDNAKTAYKTAQERVEAAQQREIELRRGNRPQEIEAAREDTKAQLKQFELLRAGSRPEDIEAQKAFIDGIKAQIKQLEETKDELFVRSPCSCQISSMDIKKGKLVLPNQAVATLTNLNDLWVRVYIPEESFGKVKPSDKAKVKVDAFPHKTFTGTVVQIASRAEFTPRNVQTEESRKLQVFGVKVELDNRENLLRPGMPADVYFELGF